MDEFGTIVRLIADVGALVVIAGLFLYIIFRVSNIILRVWENKVRSKDHDKLLDIRADIGIHIQTLLDNYLNDSSCDRIEVIEFSNSVMSVAYLPFKYMTCTYESYQFGQRAMGHMIDRISTSLFTQFFLTLQDKPYCIFDTSDTSIPMGGAMHDILEQQGATKSLCVMLKTSKGKSIGYVTAKKSTMFDDADIENIQSVADQISALLSVADK